MNLIKYYPITTHSLQDLHYEEFRTRETIFDLVLYNKYSDLEVTRHTTNHVTKRTNDKFHSYNEPAVKRIHSNYLIEDIWFHHGEIHRDDGPAYTKIDLYTSTIGFATHGYINRVITTEKLHIPSVSFENVKIERSSDKIIYKFKEGKVRCTTGLFFSLIIKDED